MPRHKTSNPLQDLRQDAIPPLNQTEVLRQLTEQRNLLSAERWKMLEARKAIHRILNSDGGLTNTQEQELLRLWLGLFPTEPLATIDSYADF